MFKFKVGDEVYTPDGRAIVTALGTKDTKVVPVRLDGTQQEPVWYANQVLKAAPSRDGLAEQASYTWRSFHPEFNNCTANVQLMATYIDEHHLPWNVDSLERAYNKLKPSLAPRDGSPVSVASAQPTAPVTTPAPVAAPAEPAKPTLSKRDIAKMTPQQYRQLMDEHPEQLEALGIRVERGCLAEVYAARERARGK
jgi:hypothetical protein